MCSKSLFIALGIEHAQRMRRIILPFVTCLSPPYFSTLSHKSTIFFGGGDVIECKICFGFVYKFYLKIFILIVIMRDIVILVHRPSCKGAASSVRF